MESSDTLGGHAHTVAVPDPTSFTGSTPVDIGFMVMNNNNYPNLVRLFEDLKVPTIDSDMSLSISNSRTANDIDDRHFEFSSDNPLCQISNLFRPDFYSLVLSILRFNRELPNVLSYPPDSPIRQMSIREYLTVHDYPSSFSTNYLLPMMAALWSSSLSDILSFPIEQLTLFLLNHKMLQIFHRPKWLTVKDRSKTYVDAVQKSLTSNSTSILTSTLITKVRRSPSNPSQWEVISNSKSLGSFDVVVFACPPPIAASMLENSLEGDARRTLEGVRYEKNEVVLHSDDRFMPARKSAWASWNCLGITELMLNGLRSNQSEGPRMKSAFVTYWLNKLQSLKTDQNFFVSLNPRVPPHPKTTHGIFNLSHPQFTRSTLAARATIQKTNGTDNLYFCGAWMGFGFHEDGLRSGLKVAKLISPDDAITPLAPPNHYAPTKPSIISFFTSTLPVKICKFLVNNFLVKSIVRGKLFIDLPDGSTLEYGDGSPTSSSSSDFPVRAKVFDPWWFVDVAIGLDMGLARSYIKGFFTVKALSGPPSVTTATPSLLPELTVNGSEITDVVGDPSGLTRLFLLFVDNRDDTLTHTKSAASHKLDSPLVNGAGLFLSAIGRAFDYLKFLLFMDNTEFGGSKSNIHAHYDLSNDLFKTFLDDETMMYSSAVYDIVRPDPSAPLVFKGTLEEAQIRKLDLLCSRLNLSPSSNLLDIGFGWGGLSIHAARKCGCKVHGITLSVEQCKLATERVKEAGLSHLITFEIIDYRTFSKKAENKCAFDRVVSCEMIEAVGHNHLNEFYEAVQRVMSNDGVLVMEAITTPEARYEYYRRAADYINSIIFPGSCCPSLHALVDAAYQSSCLSLLRIDNIGVHYAETLREWRKRFNGNEQDVRKAGFDDRFIRSWNYYLTYCEAGFCSETEHCQVLVFGMERTKQTKISSCSVKWEE